MKSPYLNVRKVGCRVKYNYCSTLYGEYFEIHLFNERQVERTDKLRGDIVGKLHAFNWVMMKVHRDTALRDILDLLENIVLLDSGKGVGVRTTFLIFLRYKHNRKTDGIE